MLTITKRRANEMIVRTGWCFQILFTTLLISEDFSLPNHLGSSESTKSTDGKWGFSPTKTVAPHSSPL